MEFLKALCRQATYNIIIPQKLFPNLILAVVVSMAAVFLILRLSRVDKDYITVTKKNIFSLLIFSFMGVVIASPLPIRAEGMWLGVVSLFFALLTLSVGAYTDRQTGTMIVGYVLFGLLIQIIIILLSLITGSVKISSFETAMVILCALILLVCCAYGSHSTLDLLLFYMCFLSILVIANGGYVSLCVVCFMTAFFLATIINGIFKLPGRLRGMDGKKEPIRFPFTTYIMIGYFTALFLV